MKLDRIRITGVKPAGLVLVVLLAVIWLAGGYLIEYLGDYLHDQQVIAQQRESCLQSGKAWMTTDRAVFCTQPN